ncbi:MAG TPA: tetratricopeptide repeat protein, partial [Polyangia bacterium]|nr:tetratricopeptide repeat protein [Polyangia bacterium]
MRHALIAALFVTSCAGQPVADDLWRAQQLESSSPAQAQQIYAAFEQRCKTQPLVNDDCALAAVRSAELAEDYQEWQQAYATWLSAASMSHVGTTRARALSRAASLAHARLGDDKSARELAWRCVENEPGERSADDALTLAVRIDEPRDWAALAAKLADLQVKLARFDVGEHIAYARALLLTRHDRNADAIAAFDALAATWPRSSLRDEAMWRAANLARAAGDFQGALRRLSAMVAKRDALVAGGYNYLQLDNAQLLIGKIYADDLHDFEHAAEAFELLADKFKASSLRDDALLELTRVRRAENDKDAACTAVSRLLREFPDSN